MKTRYTLAGLDLKTLTSEIDTLWSALQTDPTLKAQVQAHLPGAAVTEVLKHPRASQLPVTAERSYSDSQLLEIAVAFAPVAAALTQSIVQTLWEVFIEPKIKEIWGQQTLKKKEGGD